MKRLLLSLGATFLLAACGFHLAGTRALPESLKSVYIEVVNPYRVSDPPLAASLRAILQRRGATVLADPDASAVTIRLSELRETRQVLSVGLDGKALEFELITRVRYAVLRGGQALMAPDVMQVTRDYSFNAQEVLAKEAEETRLREYMQNDLAEQLVLRVETILHATSASRQPDPAAAPMNPPPLPEAPPANVAPAP